MQAQEEKLAKEAQKESDRKRESLLGFPCVLCGLWFLLEPRNTLNTRKGGRGGGIIRNLRFLSWRPWRFNSSVLLVNLVHLCG
jgi:hypothetical protein